MINSVSVKNVRLEKLPLMSQDLQRRSLALSLAIGCKNIEIIILEEPDLINMNRKSILRNYRFRKSGSGQHESKISDKTANLAKKVKAFIKKSL